MSEVRRTMAAADFIRAYAGGHWRYPHDQLNDDELEKLSRIRSGSPPHVAESDREPPRLTSSSLNEPPAAT